MGPSKRTTELGDSGLIRALKALGDPTRFRMVQEISKAGELSCSGVAQRFDVSQPTVSHHMKILLQAGVLVQRAEGKHHFTSVDQALLGALFAELPKRLSKPGPKRRRA